MIVANYTSCLAFMGSEKFNNSLKQKKFLLLNRAGTLISQVYVYVTTFIAH